jgi:F-type H+-transporting ATPase subunit gamma
MAISTRLIKRRIKSISNTRKITKAMELVAASKMRKAVQMTLASRHYSTAATQLVNEIRMLVDPWTHDMLMGLRRRSDGDPTRASSVRRTLVIIAASDRGLCGGFNVQLVKKALEFLRGRSSDELRVVTVGRRAEQAARRAQYHIAASFEAISNAPSFARSEPVGTFVVNEFVQDRTDRVFIVYMDYRSALSQIPVVDQLLPFIPEKEIPHRPVMQEEESEQRRRHHEQKYETRTGSDFFEPSASHIFNHLLPRLLETRIYQALLESSASEHSARMMAMRSATDNASSMLEDLTFTFNQARQAGITREISEISAGKAALE